MSAKRYVRLGGKGESFVPMHSSRLLAERSEAGGDSVELDLLDRKRLRGLSHSLMQEVV
jgi:hypothetical protein